MTDKYYPQAFPNEGFNGWGAPEKGMTLRDYFAAKALPMSIADDPERAIGRETHARWCYEMADAMMKAREK